MKNNVFLIGILILLSQSMHAQSDLQKEAKQDRKELQDRLSFFLKTDSIDKKEGFDFSSKTNDWVIKSTKEQLEINQSIDNRFVHWSIDLLHWRGKTYYLAVSPLASMTDYQNLYKDKHLLGQLRSVYGHRDKEYQAEWILSDDMQLYLANVNLYMNKDSLNSAFPENLQYKIMETFTGEKYNSNDTIWAKEKYQLYGYKENPCGVMPAKWVNQALYLKASSGESNYLKAVLEPYYKMNFKNGKVMAVDVVKPTKMN